MISIDDPAARAAELDLLGVDYICVHTATDVQNLGRSPYEDLSRIVPLLKKAKTAVAGGVNMAAIPVLKQLNPEIAS